jgi:hypothetical protein
MIDRSKFIYNNGYGKTTDIYLLPIGTKFEVVNGHWDGEIVELNGKKCVYVIVTDRTYTILPDYDYSLVIRTNDV